MTISLALNEPRSRMRQGRPGMPVHQSPKRGAALNKEGLATQVGSIVVDTATNSATYTWTINGVTQTYTADSSTSTTEVAAGIADVINADPLVRGQVSASAASATVTLTATLAGVSFTASDSDAKLTTTEASTAAASASTVPFGRAFCRTALDTDGEPCGGVASTSIFTPQVITLTPTFVASAVIGVDVYEIRGSERVFVAGAIFASATDLDTTIDGLVAALNTALPANTVLVAANAGTATALTFTAEVEGLEFEIVPKHHSGGASSPTFAIANTTGPSPATSLNRAFLGVTEYSTVYEPASSTATEGSYPANAFVSYIRAGGGDHVWVESTETPTDGGVVYVETAAGSSAGKFYASSSSTRAALAKSLAQWARDGYDSNDQIAAIRLGY